MQTLRFTKWSNEYENPVNHILWPSKSPDLNPGEHLWNVLEQCAAPHTFWVPNVNESYSLKLTVSQISSSQLRNPVA